VTAHWLRLLLLQAEDGVSGHPQRPFQPSMDTDPTKSVEDPFDQAADELAWALSARLTPHDTSPTLLLESNDPNHAPDGRAVDPPEQSHWEKDGHQDSVTQETGLRIWMEDLGLKVDELVERVRRIDEAVSKLSAELNRTENPASSGIPRPQVAPTGPQNDIAGKRQPPDSSKVPAKPAQDTPDRGIRTFLSRLWPLGRNESRLETPHGDAVSECGDEMRTELAIRLARLRQRQGFRFWARRDDR